MLEACSVADINAQDEDGNTPLMYPFANDFYVDAGFRNIAVQMFLDQRRGYPSQEQGRRDCNKSCSKTRAHEYRGTASGAEQCDLEKAAAEEPQPDQPNTEIVAEAEGYVEEHRAVQPVPPLHLDLSDLDAELALQGSADDTESSSAAQVGAAESEAGEPEFTGKRRRQMLSDES
eukprot:m.338750 g.338750  ORF g.338750 m.338750 type:complete len:175 (-) comp55737_c0_seq9:264-788(-)